MKVVGDWLLLNLAPPLAAALIRVVRLLVRVETIGEEIPRSIWDRKEHLILAFWHDQLMLMATAYRGPGAKILISASKDGELIARTMRFFGQGAVRGSSRRGGREAFRSLIEEARQPVDLVLTPDGPQGPRHRIKEGVVLLAKRSGRPVVPMAFVCSRGYRFRSWDRFLLPYPFARGVFSFGPAVWPNREEPTESFRDRVQQAMESNERRAQLRLEEWGVSAV